MLTHLALLWLRLSFGLSLALYHGKNTLVEVLAGNLDFPDPLGIGSAPTKLLMGVGAELVGGLLVAAGLFTRWAATVVAVGFAVAVLVHHAPDDFGTRNLSFLYGCGFVAIAMLGGGQYSIDDWLLRHKR